MIAQWENECISLSVLPVTRAMIAQWENECISLSVLPVAPAMIDQWENKCISLSVLLMARVMKAHTVGEQMNLTICPPRGPGSIPYFKGRFPG